MGGCCTCLTYVWELEEALVGGARLGHTLAGKETAASEEISVMVFGGLILDSPVPLPSAPWLDTGGQGEMILNHFGLTVM